jgi:tRNA pseudouridine55 synthase
MNLEGELLLIDKPFGVTSYDVIRFLKREYREKGFKKIKIGHAGTLDPRATGLLLVGVGKMTKQLTGLIGKSKVYEAEILLGKQTTTDDLEGEVIAEADVSGLDDKGIEEKLKTLIGEQQIAVPVYSAIKKDGKALYKYARKDQEVEVPIKTMTVHSAELKNIRREGSEVYLEVTFDVGSGTYIRSLARELGERLGVPATLSSLRRTSIGEEKVDGARVISANEIKAILGNRKKT